MCTHVEYRVMPAGFLEAGAAQVKEFVAVDRGVHSLLKCDPRGHFDESYAKQTMFLPSLPGDEEVGPQSVEQCAHSPHVNNLDDLKADLLAEGYDPEGPCRLQLALLVHETGRYCYPQFKQVLWGCEWFGPVAVRASYVEPGAGAEFHADVTEAMLASIPERLQAKEDASRRWMEQAAANGAEVFFM